ncbi:MAG: hypothetical protein NZ108_00175 [Bacteroidia bacterium]|nr:hypothetical protein [Bacteroidia bacterium]
MLKLITTNDGSPTLLNIERNVTYHSKDGAIGESRYVFIEASELKQRLASKAQVSVLEIVIFT